MSKRLFTFAFVFIAGAAPTLAGPLVIKKVGPEFTVRGGVSDTALAEVDALINGGFMVIYPGSGALGSGVLARLYDPGGAPLGPSFEADGTEESVRSPSAASLGAPGTAVFWAEADFDSSFVLSGRIVSATGKMGDVVEIERNNVSDQLAPTAAAPLVGGKVVVIYNRPVNAGSGRDLKAEVLNGDLETLGERQVNTVIAEDQVTPSVAGLSTGGFAVTWSDKDPPSPPFGVSRIKARVFSQLGVPLGPEITVDDDVDRDNPFSTIAGLPNGRFVVLWKSNTGSRTQAFESDGNEVGGSLTFPTSGQAPAIASFPNGRYIVAWDGGPDSKPDVHFQLVSSAGQKIGPERVANTRRLGAQSLPSVSIIDHRDFVLVWVSQDSANRPLRPRDIRGQKFRLNWN